MTSQPRKRGPRAPAKKNLAHFAGNRCSEQTKMYAKICPVCKNEFYSENKNSLADLASHDYCVLNKKSEIRKERRIRTSTPVAELESSPAPSFSDSVTDFFYQSWKSGLHSDDTISRRNSNQITYQPYTVLQPICYAPQVVYVNTVIFQPFLPTSCAQPVGYRPDGTFGILPNYW